MKTILFLIAAIISVTTHAQVSKVSLQASGLTCSMCSNSINKALKTIDFVQNVNPNIKTSTFEITFKDGSSVNFDKLKKKVEDAGFTVASFIAFVNFNNTTIKENEPVKIGDKTFYILNAKEKSLNGAKQIRIVDKGFVSSKDFKKNTLLAPTSGNGVYNVTI
ncbi:MAG: copper chaperone [Chitinophagaceae bacterium]|nr:MAG: copper chaperone [Chitinophagaceae bacterium]